MWVKIDRYLFSARSATNLCLGRVLFFTFWYMYYKDYEFNSFADSRYNFVWQPISFYRYFPLGSNSIETVRTLTHLWHWLMIFAIFGIFTRISVLGVGLIGTFLIGLCYNFGKIDNANTLPVMVALILGLSRCGDALSIDAAVGTLWRRLRRGQADGNWGSTLLGTQLFSGEYLWPIRLIRIYICWVYFSAGYQKLSLCGLSWIFSWEYAKHTSLCTNARRTIFGQLSPRHNHDGRLDRNAPNLRTLGARSPQVRDHDYPRFNASSRGNIYHHGLFGLLYGI